MLRLITLILTLEGLCILSMYGQPVFLKNQHLYLQQQEMTENAKGASHVDVMEIDLEDDMATSSYQGKKTIRVGKINLYQDKVDPTKWYASTGEQEVVELIRDAFDGLREDQKEFRITLSELMSDREDLWWKIFELDFNLEEISTLVDEYNGVTSAQDLSIDRRLKLNIAFTQSGMYTFSNDLPSNARQDFNYGLNRELVFTRTNWHSSLTAHTGFRYNRLQYGQNVIPRLYKDDLRINRNEDILRFGEHTEVLVGMPLYMRWHHKDRLISVIAELGGMMGYVKRTTNYGDGSTLSEHSFFKKAIINGGVAVNISDRLFVAALWGFDGLMLKTETRF